MTKSYDIKLNPLPDRELEIIGTLTAEKMALMREKALKKFKDSIELPGFRKGNAPEALIAQKVGEMKLLEEAAEIALSEEYPNILEGERIDAIGRPEIVITKLAPGNPLEFKIKTALVPEVKLGDYKKIANTENKKENAKPEPTEKEVDDVIENIRQNIAHQKVHSESPDPNSHDHREVKPEDLPEINEDFAKMIGGFKDVAEMKEKIKENIAKEKEIKEKDKRRVEILEEIIKNSTIELPKIIIEGELEKMLAQFKDDIGKSGISYEEYIKHIKKTEDDMKAEWKDIATKRAKSQVILATIAKEEKISPTEEDIKKEVDHIIKQYGDADRFRARMYVENFLTNELVFQFLEIQK